MVTEAARTDEAEDATARRGGERSDGDRVPPCWADQSDRARRIRDAAEQVAGQLRREELADSAKTAAAKSRRDRSEAGQPIVGRIPAAPHRLAEAQAHLVSCARNSLKVCVESFEDVVGGLGPGEGAWVLVPDGDPGADVFFQRLQVLVHAAA